MGGEKVRFVRWNSQLGRIEEGTTFHFVRLGRQN